MTVILFCGDVTKIYIKKVNVHLIKKPTKQKTPQKPKQQQFIVKSIRN